MATMNISLPDPMKHWAESQTRTGRYSNVSDYVRDPIRRDQELKDKIAAMQHRVDEARASDISGETMGDIRARALRQAGLTSHAPQGSERKSILPFGLSDSNPI